MQPPALCDVLGEHPLVHPAAERTTLSVQDGAIGVYFNVDHLVVTETDLYGNMLLTLRLRLRLRLRLPLLREDATSWQHEDHLCSQLMQRDEGIGSELVSDQKAVLIDVSKENRDAA